MVKKSFMSEFKNVFVASKDSGLKITDTTAKKSVKYLMDKLDMDEKSIIFLSAVIGLDNDTELTEMKELTTYLGITKMDIYEHGKSITELETRGYIINDGFNAVTPIVMALEALIDNRAYTLPDTTEWPATAVLKDYNAMLRNRGDRVSSFRQFEAKMRGNKFVKSLEDLASRLIEGSEIYDMLGEESVRVVRNIMLHFAHSYCTGFDEYTKALGYDDVPGVLFYRRSSMAEMVFDQLLNPSNQFQKSGYFANPCVQGLADKDRLMLTKKFAEHYDLKTFVKALVSIPEDMLVKSDSITPKELFYDEKTQKDVERLKELLSVEQFDGIKSRLKEANMRSGFNILLYGEPGTGKTETVLQIAKATGRDIMQVNYEDLKNKYVGDSEKQVKRLFRDYADIVSHQKVAPILLFNEADGILGKRKEGAEDAIDKMENTIQNIILQEMEKIEGILIATTNLTTNFDSAFERRFLYKIKYEKPDKSVRAHIWETMVGGLSQEEIGQLASDYDFSGGEIENIARKQKVEYILSGQAATLNQLRNFCDSEKISNGMSHNRVGFC